MWSGFVGREQDLARLGAALGRVREGGAEPGELVLLRGRRRVGKSRLVEEFVRRHPDVPAVFHTASRQPTTLGLEAFATEVERSTLTRADLFVDAPTSWDAALRLLTAAVDPAQPTIVVIDELPHLLDADDSLDSVVQRHWDRHLSRLPVMLVLVGSDLAMMEALTSHERPLFQRGRPLVVHPFTPAETAAMLGVSGADAFADYLTVGGFPMVVADRRDEESRGDFLARSLADPTSPLIVSGERMLAAELPAELNARAVLETIGAGSRTFTTISQRSGVPTGSLTRTLDVLVADKRVVAVDRAVSSERSRNTRYRVADPYLRFWLRFVGPHLPEIERGRSDLAVTALEDDWQRYQGWAVEPLVRASVERLLPDARFGDSRHVGGYWTRDHRVEVDLVGADRVPVARDVGCVGSIKWHRSRAFDRRDLADLAAGRLAVPGGHDAKLVGVCPAGFSTDGLDVRLDADDLLAAWR